MDAATDERLGNDSGNPNHFIFPMRLRMAKYALLLIGLLLLAGCQTQTSMVQTLPQPNLNAPRIAQRQYSAPPAVPAANSPRTNPTQTVAGVPRDWIPTAPARPWRWIIIHHSATPSGGAVAFDKMHRQKGWDELGYHFVIGNGTDTRDGQIEVGPRWPKQKWGAHAKTPDNRYNDYGIGICLVGNFDTDRPTAAQMRSLSKLVAYLMKTYHIPADRVLGHGDTKPTDCPGHHMSVAAVRRMATQILASSGVTVEGQTQSASTTGLPADSPRQ